VRSLLAPSWKLQASRKVGTGHPLTIHHPQFTIKNSTPISPSIIDQQANRQTLRTLRCHWLLVAIGYAVALLVGYFIVINGWDHVSARRWLLIATLVATRPLWWLWHGLAQNHRPDETALLPSLGFANAITLLRGLLIAGLSGFLFSSPPAGFIAWLPALLYMSAGLLDGLDGYVARFTDQVTKLGAKLDIELDGLGVLSAVLVGITLGRLPLWYLPLGLSRELFMAGIWLRKRKGLPVHPLTPSNQRRIVAGMQMGFLGIILWPIFGPPATTMAAVLFGAQLLASFGRDWLVVSGVIAADSPRYRRWREVAKLALFWWLPFPLRLLSVGLTAAILWRETPDFPNWLPYLSSHLSSTAGTFPVGGLWLVTLLALIALLLVAFGVATRAAAIFLLALALFDQLAVGFVWPTNALLQLCTILLIQLGGGMWARYRVMRDA